MKIYWLLLLVFLSLSCTGQRLAHSYRDVKNADYFIVFLVDAPHLDYTNNRALLKSIAKHPADGRKNRDVGHAWVYLQGKINGQKVYVEGGHSGELGMVQAKYFDGIMNYVEYGYATPTSMQKKFPRHEPNPIKYLWEIQRDGFFEEGGGYHRPTFALKIDISEQQFQDIYCFMQNYAYQDYAITCHQCCSFVAQIAQFVGLTLDYMITIPIDPVLAFGKRRFVLWEDKQYATFTFGSPDVLEASLKQQAKEIQHSGH